AEDECGQSQCCACRKACDSVSSSGAGEARSGDKVRCRCLGKACNGAGGKSRRFWHSGKNRASKRESSCHPGGCSRQARSGACQGCSGERKGASGSGEKNC